MLFKQQKTKQFILTATLILSGFSANILASPPANPHLADSPYPIFHGNNYSQASVQLAGPRDDVVEQLVTNLTSDSSEGFVSPWTVMREPYSDGSQAVYTTPLDGVAKYLIDNDTLTAVGFLDIPNGNLDFDWVIAVLDNNDFVTTIRELNQYVIIGDETPDTPTSPLVQKDLIQIDESAYGRLTVHFSIAYDGILVGLTEANKLIAVNLDSKTVIDSYDLNTEAGVSFHNSFPIDENGRIFLSSQAITSAIDWTGSGFQLAWEAEYDMRGPGCPVLTEEPSRSEEALAVLRGEPCTGSGTTPSLIGDPNSGVMVMVDGHQSKNNLVAFWRGTPPSNWTALPGYDRQVAGVLPLNYSTPDGEGHTAENSPAVFGNSIVVAQWAGFRPDRTPPKGVQRVDWNPTARQLEMVWENPNVLFNGVPAIFVQQGYSVEDGLTYGMGRDGARYYYYGLNMVDGSINFTENLGSNNRVLDQGNNHAIASDGSIVYGGKKVLVRIKQN